MDEGKQSQLTVGGVGGEEKMVVVIHCAENNSAKTVSLTPNTTIEDVYQQCLKRFPLSTFERAYGIFTCSQSKREAAGIQPLALVKLLPHFMRISELQKQPVSYTHTRSSPSLCPFPALVPLFLLPYLTSHPLTLSLSPLSDPPCICEEVSWSSCSASIWCGS